GDLAVAFRIQIVAAMPESRDDVAPSDTMKKRRPRRLRDEGLPTRLVAAFKMPGDADIGRTTVVGVIRHAAAPIAHGVRWLAAPPPDNPHVRREIPGPCGRSGNRAAAVRRGVPCA